MYNIIGDFSMKKLMKYKEILIVLMILFITSCGLIPARDICYEVGKVSAEQYLKTGTGDPIFDNAIVQVWNGFDNAVTDFQKSGIKPTQFPVYMKLKMKEAGLPPSVLEKANNFIDAAWAKLCANIKVSDDQAEEFFINIQALRDGAKFSILSNTSPK